MSKQYTCLGLMSGTSGDGIDASIICSDGQDKLVILKEKYYEYSKDLFSDFHNLKKKINSLKDLNLYSNEIKDFENKITISHAKAVKDIAIDFNLDLIGFHGQTLYHSPKEKISLQIGNGNLLSQLTKKKIVYNFRKQDIINGGEGAPLSPIFHKYLIKSKKINLPAGILNIGGISNLTVMKDLNNLNILSKDIGPGNCLIDSWIQSLTNKRFDSDGKISSKGKINEVILEQALEVHENNFKSQDNISLDTSNFDVSFMRGLSLEDGAATLTSFTAKVISSNIKDFVKDFYNEKISILLCGGGRKNKYLIDQIKLNLNENFILINSEDLNLNGDFIESQAFAFLAIRSIENLPISFPSTTRCKEAITGGIIIENF